MSSVSVSVLVVNNLGILYGSSHSSSWIGLLNSSKQAGKLYFKCFFSMLLPAPQTSENVPQFVDKLTNLQSSRFSDDNCPVEIKLASFQEFALLICIGMSEKESGWHISTKQ
jgi:hypothetical protein